MPGGLSDPLCPPCPGKGLAPLSARENGHRSQRREPVVLPANGQTSQSPVGNPVATGGSNWRRLRGSDPSWPFSLPFLKFFGQVAHPDGDFRLTIVNSSVLDRPRALVLVPQEG